MPAQPLTIWCNAQFSEAATKLLVEGTRGYRLIQSAGDASVLAAGGEDPALDSADVAFGQPDATQCARNARLKWIEVTSAGYTRYDNEAFREAMRRRGAVFTNSSSVFAEPCGQHALAMIGEADEAARRFETLLGYASPHGLLAEEVDPATGMALGNYPQAFSHIGLINSAVNLTKALRRSPEPPAPGTGEHGNVKRQS